MFQPKIYIAYLIGLPLLLTSTGCNNDKQWIEKSYYEDGNLKSEVEMVGNEQHGVAKLYFPNGGLEQVRHYKSGVRHGEFREYYGNGRLHHVAEFQNDKPHGKMHSYFKDGKRSYDSNFKNGKPIFTIAFYEDGDTMAFYNKGRAIRYFENGKIEQITCSQNEDLNSISNIRFSSDSKIIKREEPLYCLTRRDSLLLDKQYPSWKIAKLNTSAL